jgi:hypothetical protein
LNYFQFNCGQDLLTGTGPSASMMPQSHITGYNFARIGQQMQGSAH